jgi:hypothetical protein
MDINSYKDESPKLVLENYLNGNIKGYGIVQDRSKKVTRRFDFSGHASWQGSKGVFDEKIVYTNGKVETRHWLFTKVADNRYEATTNDVIGKAIITVAGNAMNWKYDMNIDVDGSIYKINFDDWMFLLDEKRLMNRNYFKKFGFNVGELTLYMEKQD